MEDVTYVALSKGQRAVIDTADATLVAQFRWYANPTPTGGYYAAAHIKRTDGRSTTLYMHRLITGAPKGTDVDHFNHDTLDNRRTNLRVGTHKQNMENGRFALTTQCPAGHPYDEANTGRNPKGKRYCRLCAKERMRKVIAAETPEQRALRIQRGKSYYERNKAEINVKNRRRAEKHKDEKREYDRQRRERLKRP